MRYDLLLISAILAVLLLPCLIDAWRYREPRKHGHRVTHTWIADVLSQRQ